MTVGQEGTRLEALDRAVEVLGRVEAEILACFVFDCTRTDLYMEPDAPAYGQYVEQLNRLLEERRSGRPLQYLTGVQPFRLLDLAVGEGVLVPRPETELVVDQCLSLLATVPKPKVIDVGTGSGAIALSIATERPDSRVWATEVSKKALRWARMNLEGVDAPNCELFLGDLFAPLPRDLRGTVGLVVSNPPYLSDAELAAAPRDVRDHEPSVALACGQQGMEIPAKIAEQALTWLGPGGWLVMETSPTQAGALAGLMRGIYEEVQILDDLSGRPRIAKGRKR